MAKLTMENLNQISESLEAIYINDEHGHSLIRKYGFNSAQIRIMNEMIIHALRLYHFYATGEKVFESDSQQ